jgi:hypothetical protein
MRWLAWLISGAACGCGVLPDTASTAPQAPLTCADDSECTDGKCLTAFGVCSQPEGKLTRLLFEVTPPASDPVYGGARFLTIMDLKGAELGGVPERGIAAGWLELNVRPQVPVSGSVLAPDQAACLSRARSTLPVTLTFTPRERLFGVPVPSYDLTSGFDRMTNEYKFRGSLPPGNYDVYMRPDTALLNEACIAIPQLFRNQQIGSAELELKQDPPTPLQLTILGDDNRDGWVVDMLNPITGELISNRVRLSAANRDPDTNTLQAKLYYSTEPRKELPDSSDPMEPSDPQMAMRKGDEVVRLTPPPNVQAGTVFLLRSGILGETQGEGQIGDVFKFGKPVQYRAWVWKERIFDSPVPASVSFAARELDEAGGIFASFNGSALVDPRGQVELSLLPGRYRVRVTPPGGDIPNLGLLSSSESNVTVWPNDMDSAAAQGGHVIEVHAAVFLGGRVVADAGGQPLAGVEVRADAASSIQGACAAPTEEQPAPPCDRRARSAVLPKAQAQDPFIPRTRNALSGSDGGFVIDGLDCAQCEPGAGARFDVSVRPPPEMRLPWLVRRANDMFRSETRRDALRVPQPVAHAMRLTYGDPSPLAADPSAGGVVPGLAGALIRVYALIDEQTRIVSDAEALIPCVTIPDSPGQRCVQSVVQLAELRSGNDGEFLLLLPPNLD